MDFCNNIDHNSTIPNTALQYGQIAGATIYQLGGSSYLRPDIGGALLPWIYTAIVIIVHIPTVIIRVQQWDTVYTWCLASTFLAVVLYTQAHISSGFVASQVLTWTPLLLVIDAGSMLQLFVLVVEAGSLITRLKAEVTSGYLHLKRRYTKLRSKSRSIPFRRPRPSQHPTSKLCSVASRKSFAHHTTAILDHDLSVEAEQPSHTLLDDYNHSSQPKIPSMVPSPSQARSQTDGEAPMSEAYRRFGPLIKDRAFWVAMGSVILFIAIFVLQVLGLKAAVSEDHGELPSVSWCAPILQPFGAALIDGDCHVYPVDQSFTNGIGCIKIPGTQQKSWVKATVVVTSMTLVSEFIDLLILVLVNSDSKWVEVKMRRPWTTIFGGMAVLGVTLLYGIRYSNELPPGITERVIVVTNVHNTTSLYAGKLVRAGLRGSTIGWNDGLFSSWGGTYFGGWITSQGT